MSIYVIVLMKGEELFGFIRAVKSAVGVLFGFV